MSIDTFIEPSQARARILTEHAELRSMLDRLDRWTRHAVDDAQALGPLRGGARELYYKLTAHLLLEDQVLAPRLREIPGWGTVLAERLAEEHRRQRERLEHALAMLDDESSSRALLIATVRSIARDLRLDMETEEKELLRPDLLQDTLIADGEAG
jgi:hemerythrin-like domain-containing protein